MTKTTVRSNIHQTFDAHLHFTTQCTFYFYFVVDDVTDSSLLFVIPLVYFFISVNTSLIKNVLGSRKTNTIYIGKTYFASFIFW